MKKHKKFGDSDFLPTFAIANENHAEIAQLVERNLAKVEVAGPSPVFRSRVAKERRIARFSFLFFGGGTGFDARDLKAPLSGAGGVNNESRPLLARSASASPVFRSRKKGKNLATLPFLFCLHGTGACAVSGFRMPIQARCSRLYCRPAGDLS